MPTNDESKAPPDEASGFSRRGFLRGAGLSSTGAALASTGLLAAQQAATAAGQAVGPGRIPITGTGFAQAEIIVDGEFRTQVQTHSQLETHGIVADWRQEGLTVYISTQGTSGVQADLAELFHLPRPTVRVITEFMGGGFGARFGPGTHGLAAVQVPILETVAHRNILIGGGEPRGIREAR